MKSGSDYFQIEINMIVVTVFHLIMNQMDIAYQTGGLHQEANYFSDLRSFQVHSIEGASFFFQPLGFLIRI